uniref:Uncharacterized protein n=1 Tax=Urocitellus parryii TaxID=9999 RepID=A0A8D2I4V1_UROPR
MPSFIFPSLGVLGQNYGPTFVPVAYLSKQLDPTIRGWAPCLRSLAAGQILHKEASKLTFRLCYLSLDLYKHTAFCNKVEPLQ